MAKKTYTITGNVDDITHLWLELKQWQVAPDKYAVCFEGNTGTVTTKNANVVDVATETFMKCMDRISIKVN